MPIELEKDLSNKYLETRVWTKRVRSGLCRAFGELPEYKWRLKLWQRLTSPSKSVLIKKRDTEVILGYTYNTGAAEEEEQPTFLPPKCSPTDTEKERQEKNLKWELSCREKREFQGGNFKNIKYWNKNK